MKENLPLPFKLAKGSHRGEACPVRKGLAFEYASARAVAKYLKCPLVTNRKMRSAEKELTLLRDRTEYEKLNRHAEACAEKFTKTVQGLVGPVTMLEDVVGIEGDVCDFEIGRSKGGAVGVSCKWNNKELKHHRLLEHTDVVQQMFSGFSMTNACRHKFRRAFGRIKEQARKNEICSWSECADRGDIIKSIVQAVSEDIQMIVEGGEAGANDILAKVFGSRDYCIFLGGRKKAFMGFFNPQGSLAPGIIKKTKMPKMVADSHILPRGRRALVLEFSGSEFFEKPLRMVFRLHQASKKISTSLKWGVRWQGSLFGFMEHLELGFSEYLKPKMKKSRRICPA